MHKNFLKCWGFFSLLETSLTIIYFVWYSIVIILYHTPAFKENTPDISLTAKNINTRELDEGKTRHDPEIRFPAVLNVSVILKAVRWMIYMNYYIHLTGMSARGFYFWCCSCATSAFFHSKVSSCATWSLSLGGITLRTFVHWLKTNTIYF